MKADTRQKTLGDLWYAERRIGLDFTWATLRVAVLTRDHHVRKNDVRTMGR